MALRHQHIVLDNGLTVIGEINDDAHTAAIGFFVKAGTRDEPAELMGVSHFLEHMMFKGTDRRTADDVNREFDEIGANYNAFTSQELTCYYAQVLPEFLPNAVDLLTDMMHPSLREDDFTMEKKVILEEISMYEDSPGWRLHDAMIERHFDGHPLSFRVLGTAESIEALPVDAMRSYHARKYAPDNIAVSVAGQVDFPAVVDALKRLTESWTPASTRRDDTPPARTPGQHDIADGKLNRHYVAAIGAGPSTQADERYVAQAVAEAIGGDDGSRLYWALIDPGLADGADFTYFPQDNVGSFVAEASCAPRRSAEVEKILLETIDEAVNKGLDQDELERAKNKLATAITLSGESPLGRMRAVGYEWTYRRSYTPLADEVTRMEGVTLDDAAALLTAFPFSPRMIVRLGPNGAAEE